MQESDGADSIYTCAGAVRLLCGVQVDPFSFVQFEKWKNCQRMDGCRAHFGCPHADKNALTHRGTDIRFCGL